MQIARVSHFGVEKGVWQQIYSIQGVLGGPTSLSESCLWRHSMRRAQRPHKCYYVFTNPMDDNLWLSCIHEATQFSLYSLLRLISPFGLLLFF